MYSAAAMGHEAIRLSTVIPATPQMVYLAWLDSAQHSAFSGAGVSKIDPNPGGKFALSDGYITGKFISLDFGRRIVQSWRTNEFQKTDRDSRLEVHLEAVFGGTRITLLHSGLPTGTADKYRQRWLDNYFTPMKNFFGKADALLAKKVPSQASSTDVLGYARKAAPPPEEEEEKPKKLRRYTPTKPAIALAAGTRQFDKPKPKPKAPPPKAAPKVVPKAAAKIAPAKAAKKVEKKPAKPVKAVAKKAVAKKPAPKAKAPAKKSATKKPAPKPAKKAAKKKK